MNKWVHKVNTVLSGSSAKNEAESDAEGAASEAESESSTPKAKKPTKPRRQHKTPPKKQTEEISTLTKSTVKVKKLTTHSPQLPLQFPLRLLLLQSPAMLKPPASSAPR